MAIKIIPERDIHLTQAEHERLRREYQQLCTYMVDPPSFEVWVRQRQSARQSTPQGGKQ